MIVLVNVRRRMRVFMEGTTDRFRIGDLGTGFAQCTISVRYEIGRHTKASDAP